MITSDDGDTSSFITFNTFKSQSYVGHEIISRFVIISNIYHNTQLSNVVPMPDCIC